MVPKTAQTMAAILMLTFILTGGYFVRGESAAFLFTQHMLIHWSSHANQQYRPKVFCPGGVEGQHSAVGFAWEFEDTVVTYTDLSCHVMLACQSMLAWQTHYWVWNQSPTAGQGTYCQATLLTSLVLLHTTFTCSS